MDPKPQKRYRATKEEWESIRYAFRASNCLVCGAYWDSKRDSLHHVYPRGQGGDDVIVNLVPLCGSGTTGCHGLIEARDARARATLRENFSDAHRWYLTYKLGFGAEAWLDRNYPALVAA